jgi:thiamine biosynthesis lipoprotein ApbE
MPSTAQPPRQSYKSVNVCLRQSGISDLLSLSLKLLYYRSRLQQLEPPTSAAAIICVNDGDLIESTDIFNINSTHDN